MLFVCPETSWAEGVERSLVKMTAVIHVEGERGQRIVLKVRGKGKTPQLQTTWDLGTSKIAGKAQKQELKWRHSVIEF